MIKDMIKKYGLLDTVQSLHLMGFGVAAVLLLFLQGPITLLLCV